MHLLRSLFFQPATCNFIEKETPECIFFRKFCEIFRNNFLMEKLLQIGFETNSEISIETSTPQEAGGFIIKYYFGI